MPRRNVRDPEDFAGLFLRLEELVLANSGEDEFEEIFKLVYAKLWDELKHGATRFRLQETPRDTFEQVNRLLAEAIAAWPGTFAPLTRSNLTPEHLAICVEVLARKSISDSGLEVMDSAFEYLVSTTSKGAKGQYFTPRHVVEFCVRMLKPTGNDLICDPACGSAAFLIHTLRLVYPSALSANLSSTDRAKVKQYCEHHLWGFDFEQRAAKVAKALMLVAGDGNANIIKLNSLIKPTGQRDLLSKTGLPLSHSEGTSPLTIEDVMRLRVPGFDGFDIVMTNPPFAGEVGEHNVLTSYELHRLKGTRLERDALFLERCLDLLRPGGRLAIVLPDNKVSSTNYDFLREWLVKKAKIIAVVGLPRGIFMPHTSQKASIVFLQRRIRSGQTDPGEAIFFAISERGGKDSRGHPVYRARHSPVNQNPWERLDHDLDTILEEYESFMAQAEG
jgi:type I restriction enzyme M protein